MSDQQRLLKLLYQQNPWWEDSNYRPPESSWPRREQFSQLQKYLVPPQILLVTGLRRTGKTTLLRQLTADLLDRKTQPQKICFFSFEEEFGVENRDALESIVNLYIEQILQKNLAQIKTPIYIFLDETQYIPNWQSVLKRIYDLNKNVKFLVSGSASTRLVWHAKESLAGRLFEIKLPILSFSEYLRLKGEKPALTIDLKNTDDLRELKNEIARRGNFLDKNYLAYLVRGQFPELLELTGPDQIDAYLKDSILEKVIAVDLPKAFTIQERGKFRQLFLLLAAESGNLIQVQSLASDLGLSRQTVAEYVSYMEAGFLVKMIYQFTRTRQRMRTQRKVYTASPNFTTSLGGFDESSPLFDKAVGHLAETAVFGRLDYLFEQVFFWRRRGKEVDFICEDRGEILPIEVKFARKISREDFSNIIQLMEQKRITKGIILTRDTARVEKVGDKTIGLIPAWAI